MFGIQVLIRRWECIGRDCSARGGRRGHSYQCKLTEVCLQHREYKGPHHGLAQVVSGLVHSKRTAGGFLLRLPCTHGSTLPHSSDINVVAGTGLGEYAHKGFRLTHAAGCRV